MCAPAQSAALCCLLRQARAQLPSLWQYAVSSVAAGYVRSGCMLAKLLRAMIIVPHMQLGQESCKHSVLLQQVSLRFAVPVRLIKVFGCYEPVLLQQQQHYVLQTQSSLYISTLYGCHTLLPACDFGFRGCPCSGRWLFSTVTAVVLLLLRPVVFVFAQFSSLESLPGAAQAVLGCLSCRQQLSRACACSRRLHMVWYRSVISTPCGRSCKCTVRT